MASGMPTVSNLVGEKPIAVALSVHDAALSDALKEIIVNAESRWLKNDEVLAILSTFQMMQGGGLPWPKEPADKPEGGKLFIFSRAVCRGFRSDKHNWRKKQDGRTVKETHEKLKVGDKERLNCYYAHAEGTEGLQRRCYWILESGRDDTVLVHYRCTSTSRAGQRSGAQAHVATVPGAHSSRPRRAAAQRARLGPKFSYDDTDEDDEDAVPLASDDKDSDYRVTEESDSFGASAGALFTSSIMLSSGVGGGGLSSMHQQQQQQQQLLQQHRVLPPGALPGGGGGGLPRDESFFRDDSLMHNFLDGVKAEAGLPSLAQQFRDAQERKSGGSSTGGGGDAPLHAHQPHHHNSHSQQQHHAMPSSTAKSPRAKIVGDPFGSGNYLGSQMSLGIEGGGLSGILQSADVSMLFHQSGNDIPETGAVHPHSSAFLVVPPGAAQQQRNAGGGGIPNRTEASIIQQQRQYQQDSLAIANDSLLFSGLSQLESLSQLPLPISPLNTGSMRGISAAQAAAAGGANVTIKSGSIPASSRNPYGSASAAAAKTTKEMPARPTTSTGSEPSQQQKVATLRRIIAPNFNQRESNSSSFADAASLQPPSTSSSKPAPGNSATPAVLTDGTSKKKVDTNAMATPVAAAIATTPVNNKDAINSASTAVTPASRDDADALHRHHRKNPMAAAALPSSHERVVAHAAQAAAATVAHRDERLQQLRNARRQQNDGGDDDDDNNDDGNVNDDHDDTTTTTIIATTLTPSGTGKEEQDKDVASDIEHHQDQDIMITAPNNLFRFTSHMVHHSPEEIKAALDETDDTALLMRDMSIDVKNTMHAGQAAMPTALGQGGVGSGDIAREPSELLRNMSIDDAPQRNRMVSLSGSGSAGAGDSIDITVKNSTERHHCTASPFAFGSDQEFGSEEPGSRDRSVASAVDGAAGGD